MARTRRDHRGPIFKKGLLSVLLFAFVLTMAFAPPRAAQAGLTPDQIFCMTCAPPAAAWEATAKTSWIQKLKNWLESFALIKQIIGIWDTINGAINAFTKLINEKLGLATAVMHVTSALKAQQKYYATQSKNIVEIETPKNALLAEEAAKLAPSMPAAAASNVLCNTIVAMQGQIAMYWFALAVENALGAATKSVGLGKYADFNGPQFIGFIDKLRCPDRTNLDDPRGIGDPLVQNSLNEPRPECQANHPDFVDADLSPPSDDYVLELPPLRKVTGPDGKEINVPVPDENMPDDNYRAQQMFMAKWKYCIIKRGAFETPPVGKARETPEGKTRVVVGDSNEVVRDAFTSLCFKMLARYTRPNCWDPQYNEVCAAGRAACDAARANGIPLPFGCDQALTLSQTEYIAHQIRLAGGPAVDFLGSGGGNESALAESAGALRLLQPSMDIGDGPSPGDRARLINAAIAMVGTPYVWGDTDCSHSINKIYQAAGLSYGYSDTASFASNSSFKPIPFADLQPGDVIVYSGHMVMYAGNGLVYEAKCTKCPPFGLFNMSHRAGQAYRYIVKN